MFLLMFSFVNCTLIHDEQELFVIFFFFVISFVCFFVFLFSTCKLYILRYTEDKILFGLPEVEVLDRT